MTRIPLATDRIRVAHPTLTPALMVCGGTKADLPEDSQPFH
jgi:hypothetical protein